MTNASARAASFGVNWLRWSIAMNPDIPDGVADMKRWTFRDLVHAHAAVEAKAEIDEFWRRQPARGGGA